MRHATRGFSLVELLVVIAIVSVLAAMLLPVLENGIDHAYRTACASNQRQLYVAAVNYAGDWNAALPYHTTLPTWADINAGSVYWVAANTPIRHYWNQYANASIRIDATNDPGGFANRDGIAHCPAARYVNPGYWKQQSGYGYPGFGQYWNAGDIAAHGSTRMQCVGQPGRAPAKAGIPAPLAAPIAFLMDTTYRNDANVISKGAEFPGKNHAYAGGNVTNGDGSCQWVLWEGWFTPSIYGCNVLPGERYTQYAQITAGFLGLSYAPVSARYNMTGADLAAMHRMFGYR